MNPAQAAVATLRYAWRRLASRGIRYSGDYKQLDALYAVADPWGMESPSEQYRFTETNRLILERTGRVASLLEVGCGEGHQSLHLRHVTERLTGLDVSPRAVKRARVRCPQAEFLIGDMFSSEVSASAPFDLVVACEVLYYMSDVEAALRRMRDLGRMCLVTYFHGEIDMLDDRVRAAWPGAVCNDITFKRVQWRVVWFDGVAAAPQHSVGWSPRRCP
jgi:SAM-dependent methyltransferase